MRRNRWDEAIEDAKAKLSGLQKTLKYIGEMKRKRMPWLQIQGVFMQR
jgi:hypothetical protein